MEEPDHELDNTSVVEVVPSDSITGQKPKKKRTFKEFQSGKEFLFNEFFEKSKDPQNESLKALENEFEPPTKKIKLSENKKTDDKNDLFSNEDVQSKTSMGINFGSKLTSDTSNMLTFSDLVSSLVTDTESTKKGKTKDDSKGRENVFKKDENLLQIFDETKTTHEDKGGDKIKQLQNTENIELLQSLDTNKKDDSSFENTFDFDPVEQRKKIRKATLKLSKNEAKKKWGEIDKSLKNSRTVPIFYDEEKHRSGTLLEKNVITKDTKFIDEFNKKLLAEKIDLPAPTSLSAQPKKRSEIRKEHVKYTREELIKRAEQIAEERRQISYLQAKRNRINKNKSRKFRKKVRKQREKEAEKIAQMGGLSEDKLRSDLEKEELEFIKERITLRHKNTSNWIKRAIKHQHVDGNLRKAVNEQVQISKDLLKKQKEITKLKQHENGMNLLYNSNVSPSIKKQVIEDMKRNNSNESKGVFGMAFMKKARERRLNEMSSLIKEVEGTNENEPSSPPPKIHTKKKKKKNIEDRNIEFEGSTLVIKEATKIIEVQNNIEINNGKKKNEKINSNIDTTTLNNDDGLNINDIENIIKKSQKKINRKRKRKSTNPNENIVTEDNMKNNPWLNNSLSNIVFEDDASVLPQWKKRKINEKKKEVNEQERKYQEDLKREAFAGDDLQLEFERKKQEVMDKELNMPEFESLEVPGWDSWVGKGIDIDEEIGIKKNKMESIRERIRSESKNERSDANLKNVIIRKTAIPDPIYFNESRYGNSTAKKKIFDNVTSLPLGPEWNTIKGHKKVILPRVHLPFRGKVIAPITKELYYQNKSNV